MYATGVCVDVSSGQDRIEDGKNIRKLTLGLVKQVPVELDGMVSIRLTR